MEDIIFNTISNIGVPAAVCFYTLFAVNKNLQKLINSVDKLSDRFVEIESIKSLLLEIKYKLDKG